MQNYIYVRSASGKPLMPTTREGHVRRLLNAGKARIACHVPLTIQLLYNIPEEENSKTPLYGGGDPGRTNIGAAAVSSSGNVLLKVHVTSCNKDVPKHMADRKAHRSASRRGERLVRKRRAAKNHTTTEFPEGRILPGYEEPVMLKDIINTEARFNNQKRPLGWLMPTARQLVDTYLHVVDEVCRLLPITDWTLEANKFAFMALEDGSWYGVDFMNGRMKGYKDTRSYVSAIQEGKCAVCGKTIEHFHHIRPRSKGGSDLPENIVGLCKACHEGVHLKKISLAEIGKKKKYSALSVLNQAIPYIYQGLADRFGEEHVHLCAGYQTQQYREDHHISKEHENDAVCIAAIGAKLKDIHDNTKAYEIRQFRRHDRSIIHSQRERTYYLPDEKKPVCKNRHKRFEQTDDSLEEFRQRHPGQVAKLIVKKSTRHYNTRGRMLPGAVFLFEDKRYVMSGQLSGGTQFRAVGQKVRNFAASRCQIVQRNKGLVWL